MKVSRLFCATSLLLSVALTTGSVVRAADAPSKPARVLVLTAELGLTPDQAAAIAPIVEARSTALKTMRADASLDEAAKKAASAEILKTYGDQIRTHLDAAQKSRYSALIKKESAGEKARLEQLTTELNLSAAQQASLATILGARKVAVEQAREHNADEAAGKAAVAAVMKEYGAKIRAELTPEQKAAYAALIKRESGK